MLVVMPGSASLAFLAASDWPSASSAVATPSAASLLMEAPLLPPPAWVLMVEPRPSMLPAADFAALVSAVESAPAATSAMDCA
jgi:hypothetical protein